MSCELCKNWTSWDRATRNCICLPERMPQLKQIDETTQVRIGARCLLVNGMRVHLRTCERYTWVNGFDEITGEAKCGFK